MRSKLLSILVVTFLSSCGVDSSSDKLGSDVTVGNFTCCNNQTLYSCPNEKAFNRCRDQANPDTSACTMKKGACL